MRSGAYYYTACANPNGRLTLDMVNRSVCDAIDGQGTAFSPVVGQVARRNWWRVLVGREVDLTHLTVCPAPAEPAAPEHVTESEDDGGNGK